MEAMELRDRIYQSFWRHNRLGETKSGRIVDGILFSLQEEGIIEYRQERHFCVANSESGLPPLPVFTMVVARGIERAERNMDFPNYGTISGFMNTSAEIYDLISRQPSSAEQAEAL